MEEVEVPLEGVQEEMQHHAEGQGGWIARVALSSAVLAVLAAISSLLAGHHSNEAVIEQIRAADQWSLYQAKGIKSAVQSSRIELLEGLGKTVSEKDRQKIDQYKEQQDQISEKAKENESEAAWHLKSHQTLARAVTMFQIGIAICAISVLTRRRKFWFVGLAFGLLGLIFFIQGLLIPKL